MKTRRPNKKDFEAFKREFLRCVDLLEVGEWAIFFKFEVFREDNFADIEVDCDGSWAVVRLNKTTLTKDVASRFDPKRSGRHEAAHLFIARLAYHGACRYVIPDMFYTEKERIARTLEKIL